MSTPLINLSGQYQGLFDAINAQPVQQQSPYYQPPSGQFFGGPMGSGMPSGMGELSAHDQIMLMNARFAGAGNLLKQANQPQQAFHQTMIPKNDDGTYTSRGNLNFGPALGSAGNPFSWNRGGVGNEYQMQQGESPFAFAARQGNPQYSQNLDRNVAAASVANQQANGWNFPSQQTSTLLQQGLAPYQRGGWTLPMDNQGRGIYFSPNGQPGTAPQFHAPGSNHDAYNQQQALPNMINQLQNQPANSQNTNWLNTMGQMFGAQFA